MYHSGQNKSEFNAPQKFFAQRRSLAMSLAIAGLAMTAHAALDSTVALAQQNYPQKPVTIIVPFAAGGVSDTQGRLLAKKLSERWGQPVIVENKPGASTMIGMNYTARANPDGYTIVFSDVGTLTSSPALRSMQYDLQKDFSPITIATYSPYLLTSNNSMPFNTLQELIDYARANPGKLNYGTSGLGTTPHLAGRLFANQLGIKWADIPAKGGSQTIQDVLGGQVDLMFNSVFSTGGHVREGRLKVFAISSEKRLADMPEVPTVSEVIPGFIAGGYQGLLAPAGTPAPIIKKISEDIIQILKSPEVSEQLKDLGAEPMATTPEEMQAFITTDMARWAKLAKEENLKID